MTKYPVPGISLLVGSAFLVNASNPEHAINEAGMTITMTVNGQCFAVALADNQTAKAFAARLPLTLTMEELNGNEKFADLARALPAKPMRPEKIYTGDLMLYGTKTVVLFYDTFPTSWRYTPVGKLIHPEALNNITEKYPQSVTVTFSTHGG